MLADSPEFPLSHLISPVEATDQLAQGADPVEVVAKLDIDACRFSPFVTAGERPPDVETGFGGFGSPVCGRLAFTQAEVDRIESGGEKAIRVQNCWENGRQWDWGSPRKNFILAAGRTTPTASWFSQHFIVNVSYSAAALLDNPHCPAITLDNRGSTPLLRASDQARCAGDVVTLDPVAGHLWFGAVPVCAPPAYADRLEEAILATFNHVAHPTLHLCPQGSNWSRIRTYPLNTFFMRTEERFLACLADRSLKITPTEQLALLLKDPDSFYWEGQTLGGLRGSAYRLVDIHALRALLPDDMCARMDAGQDHGPTDNPLFRLRKNIYTGQLRQVFSWWAEHHDTPKGTRTIVLPCVTTAEEVAILQDLVMQVAEETLPEAHRALLRRGVMIETPEAIQNIRQIAPLCDALYVGTNDLTAGLTGLPRHQLDHTAWMQARGYAGRSPFEVLVPEVLEPLRKGIRAAREANPNVTVSVCGHQVAGYHLPSTRACLESGVDALAIPALPANILRTQAAIVQHMHRRTASGRPSL